MPEEAALYFGHKGRSVFLYTERAVHIPVDCYDPARAWHLELEVCIMRYRIESRKCGSPEQCIVATANGTMSKINSSLQKLSGDPKTTSSVTEPVQWASTPGMTPLKVVFVGLILEGSIPIFCTVS